MTGWVCSEGWLTPESLPPGRAEGGCSARRWVMVEICCKIRKGKDGIKGLRSDPQVTGSTSSNP